ncbi:hypothetical protein JCM9279_003618 [Rhodotorula babjevae]
MWPFHPTGTRQIFHALFKATRTASPRAARLSRRAVRDKKLVEAEAEHLLGPDWRITAQERSASSAEPIPSSTTSAPTSSQKPSSPTANIPLDLSSISTKIPDARPLELRPTLAGDVRPQKERLERTPPLGAARSSAPSSRRPSGPQAHVARLWTVDTGRLPRRAAGARAAALVDGGPLEARRAKPLFDHKQGGYSQHVSPVNMRAKNQSASRQNKVSKLVKESQIIDIADSRASLKSDPLVVNSPHPRSSLPGDLPLDLEHAFFASRPSSLSSVRLTDPIPRAHFARAFAAEREAKLAEQVLEMYPRGASSVDLDTAPTRSAHAGPRSTMAKAGEASTLEPKSRSSAQPSSSLEQLEEQLFSFFPRGARSVDLGGRPAAPIRTAISTPKVPLRGVQDVGLEPAVPRTDPLEEVRRRTANAVRKSPQVGGEGMRSNEQLVAERAGAEEERVRAAGELVGVQVQPSTTSSPLPAVDSSTVERPLAKPASPLLEPDTPLSVLAMRDLRSRDSREADYPLGLRKIFSASPLDRRIRLAADRASEDVERAQSLFGLERLAETEPALDLARWLAEIREHRARLRRMRRLEDRCLDGEMARNEEQRLGRQLEALVVARGEFEGVVEAYRAYGKAGVVNYQVERGLVDRLVKAQALLERALVLPGDPAPTLTTSSGASASTASKAILWAGERPFFVEWDTYIRTYRYGASRALKDLEVLRRRALRKLKGAIARAHMSAFEVERRACA